MYLLSWIAWASACACPVTPPPTEIGFCASVDLLGCDINTTTCREWTADPTDCDIPNPAGCLLTLHAAATCEEAEAIVATEICREVCP